MAQTTRQRKVECTFCGCIVRMSRGAMQKYGLPTCACGQSMIPTDIEDAALLGDDVLTAHPEYVEEMRRWERRALRENRRVGERMRCGGCQAFVSSANHRCSCGFANDIRRGRNLGQWVEGASYCREAKREAREAMPF